MSDDSNIRSLFGGEIVTGEPQVNEKIVTELERLVEMAKRGDLTHFVFAGITADAGIVTTLHADGKLFAMIGATAHLQQRLLEKIE